MMLKVYFKIKIKNNNLKSKIEIFEILSLLYFIHLIH